MKGIYLIKHPDLPGDNLFYNYHYSRNYKLLPRVRVIGYAGKRINIACYNETHNIWVLVRDEDIPSNDVTYEYDCISAVLGKNTKHSVIRILDGSTIVDELLIVHYADWFIYGFSKSIRDVVPADYDNTECDVLVVDVEKMQQYRLKQRFPSDRYIGFDAEGKHVFVIVANKKLQDGKWVTLDPPLISVIYWDGSKAMTVLEPTMMNYAIVTFTFTFTSFDELYKYLSYATRGIPVASEIMLNVNLTTVEKCRLLAPLLTDIFTSIFGHKVLHTYVDPANPQLYVTVKLWAGGVNWELIAGVGTLIAGIVLIATGVGAGAGAWLAGIGMAKVGAMVGLGAILTGAGGYLLYKAGQKLQPAPALLPQEFVKHVDEAFTSVVQQISADFSGLTRFVEELYAKGKITKEVRDIMLEKISILQRSTTEKIDDLRKEMIKQIETAFQDGWKKGYATAVEERKLQLIVTGAVAGAVGFALGTLAPRYAERVIQWVKQPERVKQPEK